MARKNCEPAQPPIFFVRLSLSSMPMAPLSAEVRLTLAAARSLNTMPDSQLSTSSGVTSRNSIELHRLILEMSGIVEFAVRLRHQGRDGTRH